MFCHLLCSLIIFGSFVMAFSISDLTDCRLILFVCASWPWALNPGEPSPEVHSLRTFWVPHFWQWLKSFGVYPRLVSVLNSCSMTAFTSPLSSFHVWHLYLLLVPDDKFNFPYFFSISFSCHIFAPVSVLLELLLYLGFSPQILGCPGLTWLARLPQLFLEERVRKC